MAMGTDASNLWVVVLLVELAIVIVVCAIWCWHRWGWRQAWIAPGPFCCLAIARPRLPMTI